MITSFFKVSFFCVLIGSTVYAVENDTSQPIDNKSSIKKVRLHDAKKYRQNIENLLVAEMHFHQNHFDEASKYYDKLTDFYHNKELVYHAIQVALKRQDFKKALRLASVWHKNEPNSKPAISTLIGLYQYFGRYDEVAELLKGSSPQQVDKAIDIDTIVALLDKHPADKSYYSFLNYIEKYAYNDNTAKLFLALLAIRAEFYQEAINASHRLLTCKDKEIKTTALMIYLDAYSALDQPELALQQLKTLISQTSEMAIKKEYAKKMLHFGHADTLIKLLKQEYSEDPKQSIHLSLVGIIYESKGLKATLEYLHEQQKISNDKSNTIALYILESGLLREIKQFDLALAVIEKVDQLFPKNLSVYYSQAMFFEEVGKIEEAEQQYKKILAIDSENFSALNSLGYLLSVNTTRYDEAYGYIKKAYDLEPNNPIVIDSLGWISYQKGDLENATKYLRSAYEKMKDPEVATHLITVLSKISKYKEATVVLDEMLEKHPSNQLLVKAKADLGALGVNEF
ncbi:MAG: hypothetical protein KAH22_04880 [Thiotrichaceae bacterium]|nr:hypothetical protein [Thiotrichaceae bacterium]